MKRYSYRINDELFFRVQKVSKENNISYTKMIVKSMPKLRAIKLENVLKISEIIRKAKKNKNNKSHVASFYYSEEIHNKLFRKAVTTSTSVSFLIRRLLTLYVENHKVKKEVNEKDLD